MNKTANDLTTINSSQSPAEVNPQEPPSETFVSLQRESPVSIRGVVFFLVYCVYTFTILLLCIRKRSYTTKLIEGIDRKLVVKTIETL